MISTSEEALRKVIDAIEKAQTGLDDQAASLMNVYRSIATEWNDKKYKEVGVLIEKACNDYLSIGARLHQTKERVEKLLKEIESLSFGDVPNHSRNRNAHSPHVNNYPWSKIRSEHTSLEDVRSVNPNYSSGPQYQYNCQRCVPAYEMRRRGYDVQAQPVPNRRANNDLSYDPFAVWKNPVVRTTQGSGYSEVEKAMEEFGDNSRVQIVFYYNSYPGGHTFIAERENGVTHYLDPQTGRDASHYFSYVRPGSLRFCRIDNLEPNSRILECCQEA